MKLHLGLFVPIILIWMASLLLLFSLNPYLGKKQLIFGIIGLMILIMVRKISFIWLIRMAPFWYGVSLLLLLLVLLFGVEVHGNRAWLSLFGLVFQPSEFAKVGLILTLTFLARKGVSPFPLIAFMVSSPIILLVILEPDLGSALSIMVIFLGAFFLSLSSYRWLLYAGIVGFVIFLLGWQFIFAPYQKQRLSLWFFPERASKQVRYQTDQALIALGSGKIWGKGIQQASQSQLQFLPARHTDFLLSVSGETWGFIGLSFLFGLYGIFFYQAIRMLINYPNQEGQILGFLICLLLMFHFFYNALMNVGWLPVIGLPTPFFSYGGSFLMTAFLCCGLLHSIHYYKYEVL